MTFFESLSASAASKINFVKGKGHKLIDSLRYNFSTAVLTTLVSVWPLASTQVEANIYSQENTITNSSVDTYTVKAGDSLSLIADKFGISLELLRMLNGIKPNVSLIFPDQLLHIGTRNTYSVQEKDTLFGIARKFNVSWKAIKAANNQLESIHKIQVGDIINLPMQEHKDNTVLKGKNTKPDNNVSTITPVNIPDVTHKSTIKTPITEEQKVTNIMTTIEKYNPHTPGINFQNYTTQIAENTYKLHFPNTQIEQASRLHDIIPRSKLIYVKYLGYARFNKESGVYQYISKKMWKRPVKIINGTIIKILSAQEIINLQNKYNKKTVAKKQDEGLSATKITKKSTNIQVPKWVVNNEKVEKFPKGVQNKDERFTKDTPVSNYIESSTGEKFLNFTGNIWHWKRKFIMKDNKVNRISRIEDFFQPHQKYVLLEINGHYEMISRNIKTGIFQYDNEFKSGHPTVTHNQKFKYVDDIEYIKIKKSEAKTYENAANFSTIIDSYRVGKIGTNYCGKDIRNLIHATTDIKVPISGMHGYAYEAYLNKMSEQGFFLKVYIGKPSNAKWGWLLTYRASEGREYGHIEAKGDNWYFHGFYMNRPGGSIPGDQENSGFTWYAYYPISSILDSVDSPLVHEYKVPESERVVKIKPEISDSMSQVKDIILEILNKNNISQKQQDIILWKLELDNIEQSLADNIKAQIALSRTAPNMFTQKVYLNNARWLLSIAEKIETKSTNGAFKIAA